MLAPSGAAAADDPQAPGGAQSPAPARDARPDFFFGVPNGWFTFRAGLLLPRAGGDLFTFVGDQLTIDRSDFRTRAMGMEVGIVLTETLAAEGAVDWGRRSIGSEYRHFISSTGQPITQTTSLNQTGLSGGLRFTPAGLGRRVSRYAFIPRRFAPYAGGGLTVAFYRFSQQGQFVDFVDRSIFTDAFASDGWVTGPYVHGGLDLQLYRRLYLNVDARYVWLRADLDADFTGFDGIDLAGFRGATGFSLSF
jgi:hypothetical protein